MELKLKIIQYCQTPIEMKSFDKWIPSCQPFAIAWYLKKFKKTLNLKKYFALK